MLSLSLPLLSVQYVTGLLGCCALGASCALQRGQVSLVRRLLGSGSQLPVILAPRAPANAKDAARGFSRRDVGGARVAGLGWVVLRGMLTRRDFFSFSPSRSDTRGCRTLTTVSCAPSVSVLCLFSLPCLARFIHFACGSCALLDGSVDDARAGTLLIVLVCLAGGGDHTCAPSWVDLGAMDG